MESHVTPRTTGPTQGEFSDSVSPGRWQGKALLGTLVNGAVLSTPIIVASLIGLIVARLLPRPHGLWWFAWVLTLIVVSQVTVKGTERVVRRLLPLGSLMQMSLVFPDDAPSRFALALRTGNVEKLRRSTAEAVEKGLPSELSAAAETALVMVAQLNRHDRGTRGHSERVRAFSEVLAEELGCEPEFRDRLRWGALLHDMGKLTVPAEILNKPGKPTAEEWVVLSGHPGEGERILAPLAGWLGDAVNAAGQHHERWDGKGYPRGLAGEEISLSARIVAVADAFAVMTGARAYKKPLPMVKARQELTKNAGTQFDPVIVRAMLNVSIRRINAAAGPLSALANVPFIGSLIAGVPTLPATLGSGAVAVAMTSAGMIAPVISPVEWILPSSQTAPTELAFEAPLEAPPIGQTSEPAVPTSLSKPVVGVLAFDDAEADAVADQVSATPTAPVTTVAVTTFAITTLAPAPTGVGATTLPSIAATPSAVPQTGVVTSNTNPVTRPETDPPTTIRPGSSLATSTTIRPTSQTSPTTVASTEVPQTKPPSETKPISPAVTTTTISSVDTIGQTVPTTFPSSETTPPIIATTTTIDPESTKPTPPPSTQAPTTQLPTTQPPTTAPPTIKPLVSGPGGTVKSD